MNKKLNKIFISLFAVVFGLIVWEVCAEKIDSAIILPHVGETFSVILELIPSIEFWLTVLYTLGRILAGLALGISLGVALGYISALWNPIHSFLSPFMTVIRCTPVASFIVIMLFMVDDNGKIPAIIAILMVLPIIWQSTADAFGKIDRDLYEVSVVFNFSFKKRIRYVYIPTVNKYLVPAIINSIGLSWKAGVAAEIITYTKKSIGIEISYAKDAWAGAEIFAWTLVVVLLSLGLEYLAKRLLRRVNRI